MPVYFIILPLAAVGRAVSPSILAEALFLAQHVVSLVLRTFRPSLHTASILLVVFPATLVPCAFDVLVDALAVCFVVVPLAFVDIAVHVVESALALCHVELPLADVFCAVRPFHRTLLVSHAAEPLSLISRSSSVRVRSFCDLCIFGVISARKRFLSLLKFEVLHCALVRLAQDSVSSSFEPPTNQALHSNYHHRSFVRFVARPLQSKDVNWVLTYCNIRNALLLTVLEVWRICDLLLIVCLGAVSGAAVPHIRTIFKLQELSEGFWGFGEVLCQTPKNLARQTSR